MNYRIYMLCCVVTFCTVLPIFGAERHSGSDDEGFCVVESPVDSPRLPSVHDAVEVVPPVLHRNGPLTAHSEAALFKSAQAGTLRNRNASAPDLSTILPPLPSRPLSRSRSGPAGEKSSEGAGSKQVQQAPLAFQPIQTTPSVQSLSMQDSPHPASTTKRWSCLSCLCRCCSKKNTKKS